MVTREWLIFDRFIHGWEILQIAFRFDVTEDAVWETILSINRAHRHRTEMQRWYKSGGRNG